MQCEGWEEGAEFEWKYFYHNNIPFTIAPRSNQTLQYAYFPNLPFIKLKVDIFSSQNRKIKEIKFEEIKINTYTNNGMSSNEIIQRMQWIRSIELFWRVKNPMPIESKASEDISCFHPKCALNLVQTFTSGHSSFISFPSTEELLEFVNSFLNNEEIPLNFNYLANFVSIFYDISFSEKLNSFYLRSISSSFVKFAVFLNSEAFLPSPDNFQIFFGIFQNILESLDFILKNRLDNSLLSDLVRLDFLEILFLLENSLSFHFPRITPPVDNIFFFTESFQFYFSKSHEFDDSLVFSPFSHSHPDSIQNNSVANYQISFPPPEDSLRSQIIWKKILFSNFLLPNNSAASFHDSLQFPSVLYLNYTLTASLSTLPPSSTFPPQSVLISVPFSHSVNDKNSFFSFWVSDDFSLVPAGCSNSNRPNYFQFSCNSTIPFLFTWHSENILTTFQNLHPEDSETLPDEEDLPKQVEFRGRRTTSTTPTAPHLPSTLTVNSTGTGYYSNVLLTFVLSTCLVFGAFFFVANRKKQELDPALESENQKEITIKI